MGVVLLPLVDELFRLEVKVGATTLGSCCREFEDLLFHLQHIQGSGHCGSFRREPGTPPMVLCSGAKGLDDLPVEKNTVNSEDTQGSCLDVLPRGGGQRRVSTDAAAPTYPQCEVGQAT